MRNRSHLLIFILISSLFVLLSACRNNEAFGIVPDPVDVPTAAPALQIKKVAQLPPTALPTPTRRPTNTPTVIPTLQPTATETAIPTATLEPTATSEFTATPEPTATSEPTATPDAGVEKNEEESDAVVKEDIGETDAAPEEDGEEAVAESEVAAAIDEVIRSPMELRTTIGCTACHNASEPHDPSAPVATGPNQGNLHETAGTRVEGMSAEEYVYNSIVDPCSFLVEGYFACLMVPNGYQDQMSEAELQSLVAWFLDPNRE